MTETINSLVDDLVHAGVENVYTTFDADPIRSKGEIITLVGIRSFEAMTPVYSPVTVYVPFRAELEISLLAPENTPLFELCRFFEEKIRPVLDSVPEISGRPVSVACRHDRVIRRLTLTAAVRTEGVRRIQREEEA